MERWCSIARRARRSRRVRLGGEGWGRWWGWAGALASLGGQRRQRALPEHGVVGAGELDVHVLVQARAPPDRLPAAAAGLLLGSEPLGILGLIRHQVLKCPARCCSDSELAR